jgi:hypothetical protein
MPSVTETLWAVLLGGAIATLAPIVVEMLRADRESKLDQAKRADDRRIERDRIQRETLLELQPALNEFVRGVVLIQNQDRMTLKEKGKLFQLPGGLSDAEFEAGRRLIYLTERVLDDELRDRLTDLRAYAATSEVGKLARKNETTVEDIDRDQGELMRFADETQKRLGDVLRSYL